MPEAAPAPEVEDKVFCYLCRCRLSSLKPVAINKTRAHDVRNNTHIKHWILPEAHHTDGVKTRLWTRTEANEAFISACYICHQAAENSFTSVERAVFVNTPSKLKNALIEIGWRDVRNSGKLTPAKLKNYKWRTQELLDYKLKNCTFNDVTDLWSTKGDLNSLVNKGEALDMWVKATKDGEALAERLETRLTTKHDADIAGVKGQIDVATEKLEQLKEKFEELEETVDEDERDVEVAVEVEVKTPAHGNKKLIGILRRDLDMIKEELETYKESKNTEDRARDEKLHLLLAGFEELKAGQSQTKRLQRHIEKLEWKLTEATAPLASASAKGKGKRKREEEARPAQFPPTANQVMADAEAVLAKKNRKIWTQISHSDSGSTDASSDEEAVQQRPSKVPPPAKRRRVDDGVEVSIPTHPTARRSGQSVSSPSAKPAVARNVATKNAARNTIYHTTNDARISTANVYHEQPTPAEVVAAEAASTEKARQAALAKEVQQREEIAEALRQAAVRQAVDNIVGSTTIKKRIPAVDMSPSRQAAAASSSGTSDRRPALYPSPRTSASGSTSQHGRGSSEEQEENKPQSSNTVAGGINITANAPARTSSDGIRSIFPSLQREDSVPSTLPDLPFMGKKAKVPIKSEDLVQEINDEPVYVAHEASARSVRQEQRQSLIDSAKKEDQEH